MYFLEKAKEIRLDLLIIKEDFANIIKILK